MRRPVAALLAATYLSACSSWQIESLTPERLVADRRPPAVRVTRADGSRVVLYQPQTARDSLIGSGSWKDDRPVGVAVADVTRVETRRFDPAKTTALVLGIGAAVGAALLIAVAKSFEGY